MSIDPAVRREADAFGFLRESVSIYVLAALTYRDTHARKHAFVEELCRRGFEAVYVEKPSSRNSILGKAITLNRSRPWLCVEKQYVTLPSGVRVLAVPKKASAFGVRLYPGRRASEWLVNKWLREYFRGVRDGSPKKILCLATTPAWEPLVRGIEFDYFCYDCVDALSVLRRGYGENVFRQMERALVERSDFLITPTEPLAEHLRAMAGQKEVIVIPNGVDLELFQRNRLKVPERLAEIARPRVGYVGQIADFIDTDLICRAARALPEYSFVLVGNISSRRGVETLLGQSNVYPLGFLPFEQIPGVVDGLDVCLNPFRAGSIADVTKPVKLYEYLALGKPVVSTHMPQLLELGDRIYMARTEDEFVRMIRLAVAERDPARVKRRIEYAGRNTWQARVDQFLAGVIRNSLSAVRLAASRR
ncbi:MAG: glycosyltransferase [bacterium]